MKALYQRIVHRYVKQTIFETQKEPDIGDHTLTWFATFKLKCGHRVYRRMGTIASTDTHLACKECMGRSLRPKELKGMRLI